MKNTSFKKIAAPVAALVLALILGVIPAGAVSESAGVKLNCSPVAENMELDTYRGVSVTGTFKCLDPEGDAVTYSVTRQPKKGTVEITGSEFIYTPGEGKKGKDTFTYAAVDSAGNVSNSATVTVNIKKQKTAVSYKDMAESPAWYAATALAENGVFVGECIGGEYLFRPESPVTRGEFLVMCMKLTGAPIMEGITRTGFSDDDTIPDWQKPYVTTAVTSDIISGGVGIDGRPVFSPDATVTFAEASVMLNNALGITDVEVRDGEDAWAAQASANLASCDIIRDAAVGVSALGVTREDAALMLGRAMEILDGRKSDSLLGWAK